MLDGIGELVSLAEGAEMNAHLSKPFDINKLMEVLTSLLDLEYTEDENVQ